MNRTHRDSVRVAVVGGTGFIGRATSKALVDASYRVVSTPAPRLLSLSDEPTGLLREAANYLRDLEMDLVGYDVVVNAAGMADATSVDHVHLKGANSLLPVVLSLMSSRDDVKRYIHISSAAVQGRTACLDETATWLPESPYGKSKALAEQALILLNSPTDHILRPTSVHGPGRPVTRKIEGLARRGWAPVSAPGTMPTPQVHVGHVASAIVQLSDLHCSPPKIALQPSEGFTTSTFLSTIGGRRPPQLPSRASKGALAVLRPMGAHAPRLAGYVRRLELLLLGQRQTSGWLDQVAPELRERHTGWCNLDVIHEGEHADGC